MWQQGLAGNSLRLRKLYSSIHRRAQPSLVEA